MCNLISIAEASDHALSLCINYSNNCSLNRFSYEKNYDCSFIRSFIFHSFCQNDQGRISLIPVPVSMQTGKENFVLAKNTTITVKTNDGDAKRVADFMSKKLSVATGFSLPVKTNTNSNSASNISLSLVTDTTLGNEGYKLMLLRLLCLYPQTNMLDYFTACKR